MGAEQFGYFSFINATTILLFIFVDFGINFYAVREVAGARERATEFTSQALTLKFILSVIVLSVVIIVITRLNIDTELALAFLFATISIILDSIIKLFYSIFLAFEKAEYESSGLFIERVLILGLGLAALAAGFGLNGAFAAYVLSRAITLSWILAIFRSKFGAIGIRGRSLRPKKLVWASFPYALNIVLGLVAFKVDIFMLKFMRSASEVGIYSAAITFFTGLIVIADIYQRAVYPVMSRQFVSSKKALAKTIQKSTTCLFMIGIPVSIISFFQSDTIIGILFDKSFLDASHVLRILVLILPLSYVNHVLGITITSIGRQAIRPLIAATVIPLNVILNLVLIPEFGATGAALATVLSKVALGALYFLVMAKYFERLRITRPMVSSLFAGGVMVASYLVFPTLNLHLVTAVAAALYLATHLASGSLRYLDIRLSSFQPIFDKIVVEPKHRV